DARTPRVRERGEPLSTTDITTTPSIPADRYDPAGTTSPPAGTRLPDVTLPEPDEGEEFQPLAGRAPVSVDSPRFADLGVDPSIVQALDAVGITRTFAIQELTLPIALAGSDLIGQARTGTGKTLGFGVPLLQRIQLGGTEPRALVVVPTRELCIQVTRDLQAAGAGRRARCAAIYGGR